MVLVIASMLFTIILMLCPVNIKNGYCQHRRLVMLKCINIQYTCIAYIFIQPNSMSSNTVYLSAFSKLVK
ncbi:hypothetical protein C3B55_00906 [Candidatus Pseudomonas adelgestsugas]|uniref:Secreted protein n=1 Tax=Candidatus Pseudomonas adelgestsugas TaxID=1302376 RepID=A0ABX5R9D2_9PSED|nr:hypothetical protein C3B55_00906 [Candidatus Pseudomonas adelgestsugas]